MEKLEIAIPIVLEQISKVLSALSNDKVTISRTGNYCPDGNGKLSIEFKEIEIPATIISTPCPQYSKDQEGIYKVNRIRLGQTILKDTAKGFPFSENEIKSVIKGNNVWAYYEPIK